MNVSDAVEEYLDARKPALTAKTLRWYTYHLERFQSWCVSNQVTDLSELTPQVVQSALDAYDAPSTHSKHGYAQVVRGFLHWYVENGVKTKTVRRLKMPEVEPSSAEVFTPDDINKILKATEQMPFPIRAKAIVYILLDTGIRAAELCRDPRRPGEQTGLLLKDVHLEDNYIRVVGKGGKTRVVGFGVETANSIRAYIEKERYKEDNPYLFLSRKRMGLSNNQLNHFMTDLGKQAGVPDCYPHRFRYTFAVNHLINGTPDSELMYLLGHTELETTRTYVRAMSDIQVAKLAPSVVDIIKKRQHL